MAEQIADFKTFSQVTDPRWYPRYHLAAPFGWCNDPNGMCFYKGQYHFFYHDRLLPSIQRGRVF